MRTRLAVGILAVVLVPGLSRADDAPDAGAHPNLSPDELVAKVCARGPDHARALSVRENAVGFIKVAGTESLAPKRSLDTLKTITPMVRADVAILHCNEPALSPKELLDFQAFEGSTSKWADAEDSAIATEDTARADVVLPLCEAHWGLDAAKADMAHEKANPSGVVDLVRLHSDGEAIQQYQAQIDALKPLYLQARHHGFTTWQSEGACVAAANAPEGS